MVDWLQPAQCLAEAVEGDRHDHDGDPNLHAGTDVKPSEPEEEVLAKLHIDDPMLDIAKGLEAVALEDEYFVQRKLYPNVDFYSGVILRALGIPTEMFTVIFAIGRMPGWIAQWYEESKSTKISRPRQIYTGSVERTYQPIGERS